jgi:SAM-dependent methyltransferase
MHRNKPNWIGRGYYWLTERLYNELAVIYDPVSWVVSLGQWDTVRKWVLDYLVGERVLEVGFGTGELLLELRRRNFRAVGMDRSLAMHRQTRRKFRRSGIWAPLVRGVTQQMPFANNSFDSIIATYPAGYIFDPATWSEVSRLLHPAGLPAIDTRQGRFIVVGIGFSSDRNSFGTGTRLSFGLPMDDLLAHFEQLAKEAGLELHVFMRKHGALDIPVLIAQLSSNSKTNNDQGDQPPTQLG